MGILSKATCNFYKDQAGEWRWRLVHDNGNIIAESGEGYTTLRNCKNGFNSTKTNIIFAKEKTHITV